VPRRRTRTVLSTAPHHAIMRVAAGRPREQCNLPLVPLPVTVARRTTRSIHQLHGGFVASRTPGRRRSGCRQGRTPGRRRSGCIRDGSPMCSLCSSRRTTKGKAAWPPSQLLRHDQRQDCLASFTPSSGTAYSLYGRYLPSHSGTLPCREEGE
jgi:hypothetical protein